ncbi:MAG TPA: hypothetical protein VK717_01675 [Opitutaceae bacterium]|jgi:glutathione synthase/RimK-type ligase-like ATP-grasp enzyme|nr:hypothetical protein [Opitutaceae bacterium]
MKGQKIIIVTQDYDPHADGVIRRLRAQGHQPTRLHLKDIPLESGFTFTANGAQCGGMLHTKKGSVALDDIRSIWWRKPVDFQLPEELTRVQRAFARGELKHALSGLWLTLDCYWMSYPSKIYEANLKPGQLKVAAELGFEIPRTLITMRPEEALNFYEQCDGKMIYKVLTGPYLRQNYASSKAAMVKGDQEEPDYTATRQTYATLLKEEDLKIHLSKIANAPCQFQEYIEKKVELRVTIIGDDIFVAEIDSQANERTKIDWRHYDAPMIIRKGSLPSTVTERCFALVKRYGLNFSTMDIILTPDGRYIFLENNPNGQWAFVEDHVPELKMYDALIGCLIRGSNGVAT